MEHNSHQYKSTFRFNTLTPFNFEHLKKAKHIINHIIQNPESAPFREPVNWEELKLPDYLDIIKCPMDLGSIRRKLEGEIYANVQEFLDDFQLIWDNCKTYNIKGTWIYGLADKLQKNGKKMLKNYFPQIPIQNIKTMNQSTQPPKPSKSQSQPKQKKSQTKIQSSDKLYYQDDEQITMAEKMRLADTFKAFSPEQNKQLVEYIKSVCPTAFLMGEERAQIVVDNIDIVTFKQILGKVEEIARNQEEGLSSSMKKIKLE